MLDLADRMKDYEGRFRRHCLRRVPLIVRVDGRAFHTFTRRMEKPFDINLSKAMETAAKAVAKDMQGFRVGYVQSDEASFLLTDYSELNTGSWFDYCQNKVESIAASLMTAHFNKELGTAACFDARAFNVPKEDVANYFLWRAKDWHRNSISMYAGAFFSHKQLMNKSIANKHEMLHKIGKNWATDVSERFKNGVWFTKDGDATAESNYVSVSSLVDQYL